MASLSTCHLGLWHGWQILLNLVKSRVYGILPKLLQEILEQISTPLLKVFNLSLEEGVVPTERKEANIALLFK